MFVNPYIKVTGCQKQDQLFSFTVLLIGPGKVYNSFERGYLYPPTRNDP